MPDALQEAGISWKYYGENGAFFPLSRAFATLTYGMKVSCLPSNFSRMQNVIALGELAHAAWEYSEHPPGACAREKIGP
jgi:hypothetical protein